VEGGAVHFVDDLHARAVEEERNDDVGEAFLRGDVEGSLAPLTASAGGAVGGRTASCKLILAPRATSASTTSAVLASCRGVQLLSFVPACTSAPF
jgi:hypothetical protein